MSEALTSRALTELLRGKGAHVDPLACVEDIPAELAVWRAPGLPHSVADLVFHMNYWMDYELRRIRGERPRYPEHSAESFPATDVMEEWNRLRDRFVFLLTEFIALAELSAEELSRQVETVHEGDTKIAGTVEAVLWQMAAHNSYHVGQVVLVRQALGAWPPQGGGDTW